MNKKFEFHYTVIGLIQFLAVFFGTTIIEVIYRFEGVVAMIVEVSAIFLSYALWMVLLWSDKKRWEYKQSVEQLKDKYNA